MLFRWLVLTLVWGLSAACGSGDGPGSVTSSPAEAVEGSVSTTSVSTTSVPVTSTTSTMPVSADSVGWPRVSGDVVESVVGLFDIKPFGSGLVALGFAPGADLRQDGVILASEDGVTWVRLAEDDPALTTGTALMYGIAEGGPGLVGVGMSCEDDEMPCVAGPYPTVWTSTDGTVWTRTQLELGISSGVIQDVLVTAHGIVAAGKINEPASSGGTASSPVVWLSTDGIDWSRVWQGTAVVDAEGLRLGANALIIGPDGLIVAAGSAIGESGDGIAAVWVSSDAETWERVEATSMAFKSARGYDVTMLDVAAGRGALVAVGSDGFVQAALWASTDGRSWTRVDTSQQPFESATSLSVIAPVVDGFVAIGPEGFFDAVEQPVTVWTSPDGVSWSRADVVGTGYAQSAAVSESGLTIAGGTHVDDNFHAAIWTGPAPDPTRPNEVTPSAEGPAPIVPLITSRRSGLTCEELAADGYSYAEVAIYWILHETPADLDPDTNAIPCELAYSPVEVADVFGPAQAMAITIDSHLAARTPFQATGPAVEAGVICPTGTAEQISNPPAERPEAYHRWHDSFTCADGSGTFIIGTDVIHQDMYEYGIWEIVSGTGAYTTLEGGGTCTTGPIDIASWGGDQLAGRITKNP